MAIEEDQYCSIEVLLIMIKKVLWKIINQSKAEKTTKKMLNLRKRLKYCKRGIGNKYLMFIYNRTCDTCNCFVPLDCEIDEDSVAFPHGLFGVFISQGARIGKNCTLFHHVTIGSNNLSDSKHPGAPIIGDNVFIGAGAAIIGSVRIGNGVRIGANAVVFSDIPDNYTVVAQNRMIPHSEQRDNDFKAYRSNKK